MWQKRLRAGNQPSTDPWNNGTILGRTHNHRDYAVWHTFMESISVLWTLKDDAVFLLHSPKPFPGPHHTLLWSRWCKTLFAVSSFDNKSICILFLYNNRLTLNISLYRKEILAIVIMDYNAFIGAIRSSSAFREIYSIIIIWEDWYHSHVWIKSYSQQLA